MQFHSAEVPFQDNRASRSTSVSVKSQLELGAKKAKTHTHTHTKKKTRGDQTLLHLQCSEGILIANFGPPSASVAGNASSLETKKINRNHINICRPSGKRDRTAILLWNSTENGWSVPGTGPGLSQVRVLFVPGKVPICPGHRPAQNVYVYWAFFLPE